MLSGFDFFAPVVKRPALGVLLVMIALVMSGTGLVAPILSVYAASFSASSTMIGMIITLFGVGRLIANIPAGLLSQRIGRRPLMMAGPAIIIVGAIGAALTGHFAELVFWRFVQGIGSGVYMTTSSAMLADVAEPKDRGRVMALYQAGLLVGAGIGPAIGGALALRFGYTAPFWGYAVVCALALIVAWRSTEETAVTPTAVSDTASPGPAPRLSADLLGNPLFLLVCLINFGVFFTRTASQWQLIPLLAHDSYGLDVDALGLALSLSAAANFVFLPVAGRLIERHGARSVTVWSSLVTGAALIVIAVGGGTTTLWIGLMLMGVAGALNGPSVGAFAAEIMPRALYGPAMGVLRSSGDCGFILGPILVGLLDDLGSVGHTGGILFNAVLVLATGAAFGAIGGARAPGRPPSTP
jgi:multidrug resistance protein